MSFGRWCGTAELTPLRSVRPSYRFLRPRSRENLSPAGTSHFPRPWGGHVRRTASPDNNDIVLSQCFPAMSYVSVVGYATCPARGISQSSGRGEFHHKRLRSYVLTCFHRLRTFAFQNPNSHQSGRRHGHLCNTLIIKYHLFRAWITEDFLTTNPHRTSQLIINQAIAKTDVAPSRQQA